MFERIERLDRVMMCMYVCNVLIPIFLRLGCSRRFHLRGFLLLVCRLVGFYELYDEIEYQDVGK